MNYYKVLVLGVIWITFSALAMRATHIEAKKALLKDAYWHWSNFMYYGVMFLCLLPIFNLVIMFSGIRYLVPWNSRFVKWLLSTKEMK